MEELLSKLSINNSEDEIQEALKEIKQKLIQSADASSTVINSNEFFNVAELPNG